jgi:hypothetical protein
MIVSAVVDVENGSNTVGRRRNTPPMTEIKRTIPIV